MATSKRVARKRSLKGKSGKTAASKTAVTMSAGRIATVLLTILVAMGIVVFLFVYKPQMTTSSTAFTTIVPVTVQPTTSVPASTTIQNEINAACPCLNEMQIDGILGLPSSSAANFSVGYLPNAAAVYANASLQSFGNTNSIFPTNITAAWIISYNSAPGGPTLSEYVVANSKPEWLSNYYRTAGYGTLKFGTGSANGLHYYYNSTASKFTMIGYKDGYTAVILVSSQAAVSPGPMVENLSYTI
jgi:hypothetical protein